MTFDEVPEPQPAVIRIMEPVTNFFGPDTPLKDAHKHGGRAYEDRPQQRELAQRIAACFEAKRHLFAEAPTGVGKSFSYLIPAIFLAQQSSKPVVISTHTIALQEQLVNKDIPLLRKLLDMPIKAALAKGRQNYVCLHRLGQCEHNPTDYLPNMDTRSDLSRILRWAKDTEDGSLSDLDFKPPMTLWNSLCSEVGVCPRDTKKHGDCFFQKARKRLFSANLIIANHALLCADLAMRQESEEGTGLLPDYSAVVIDEAHTFENVAATHLGLRFTTLGLYITLNRLLHPRTEKGLLSRATPEIRSLAVSAHDHTTRFFKRLLGWLEDQEENPLVYQHAGHIPNLLAEPFSALCEGIHGMLKGMDDEDERFNELDVCREKLLGYRDTIDAFLQMSVSDSVYWFERFGRDQAQVSLNAVPVEVKHILKKVLFGCSYPVIMTSATMAVDQNLTYFKERLGSPQAEELVLDSPFNHESQVKLYLPDAKMPDPRQADEYMAACCTQVKRFVNETQGRAFLLFTNYSTMNIMADLLADYFDEQGYRVLVQGREHQRSQMLEIFKEDTSSVLFGTDSFWMGVDVPGESLSNVIIMRLPFPVPSHPLTSAICNRIEQQGMSSFKYFSLPEAVLKFRQGCGRLIRSQDDQGIIVVLDPRITTKYYGRTFIHSLPPCPKELF